MSDENRTTSLRTRIGERRFLPSRSIAALCLLMLATGLIFAATASQAANPPCPTPGNFEIDGDMLQATCAPPGDDWNTAGLAVQTSSQGGTYNTSNKDSDPTSGWSSGGGTPDKADFQRAYSFARVVGGHYFVYLAWERTSTSGTQSYNIELDNSGTNVAADGTPQPNRASGGTVFYIDAQGGGLPTFGSDCTFTSQSDYGSTCSNSGTGFAAAFNTAAITDPLNGNASVAAGGFDEIALDVTALTGLAPSCPGPSAASLYLRSATGNGHKNLKGYLEPFVLQPDSTCIPPPITTTATPGGPVNPKGSTQNDTVTVGNGNAPGVGTVKFFLCTPANLTVNGDCASGGTQIGAAKTLDANGNATGDNVTGATVPDDNASGKYCWRAEFTPSANDHHYLAGSDSNGDDSGVAGAECFTIIHRSPTIGTQIAVNGQNSPSLGFTTLGDTATLTGGFNTNGQQITFSLYGPFANGVQPDCTAAPVFTTTGTLNAGSATTSQTYTPIAAGTYVWVASYNGDQFNDGVTGNCTDANESTTILAPSLAVTKTADSGTVSAGDPIGFTIHVANGGPGTAKNVTLMDPLPGGTTAAGWGIDSNTIPNPGSCTINVVPAGQELDCTAVDLGAGDSYDIHISAKTDFQNCTNYDNTATASEANGPDATGHDSIQCNKPSLTITKTADNATVDAGDPIGFTIHVANGGPGTAKNVTLMDPLPGGTTAAGWGIDSNTIPNPGSCTINVVPAGQELDCTAVDLGAGDSYDIHISAKTDFQNCTNYDNTATASEANGPDATGHDSIQCNKPSLTITKTADNATVDAGDPIGFTIHVANGGPGTAKNVTLMDPLPGGTTAAGWGIESNTIPNPGSCTINVVPAGQELDCTAVDLGAGDSYDIHISAKTDFQNCTNYDNTATASEANGPDATGHDSIQCNKPSLTITKTAGAGTVSAGDPISFTIHVANGGPGTAKNVTLNDPLPAGTINGWSFGLLNIPNGSCVLAGGLQLNCSLGDLAPGASADIQMIAGTDAQNCTKYDNTATASADNAPDASASASIQCLTPGLNVIKTADNATVDAGDPLGFTITVANGGPGTAKDVTLKDPLPGGTTAGWSIDSSTIPGPGSCAINVVPAGQELDCTAVDLGAKAGYDIHIIAQTDFQNCTNYDNTATASASNTGDATGTASIQCNTPSLTVTKTADNATVDAGDPLGFTIHVANGGPGTAKGVTLMDPLPAGTTGGWTIDNNTIPNPGSCTINAVPAGQELDCTAVDLGPNSSYDLHISASTSFADCTTYDNTATASATNSPDATGSDSIQCSKGLVTITKTADHSAPVNAGDPIGFTVEIKNTGNGRVTGAVLNDALPAGSGSGVTWAIDPAVGTPAQFVLAGAQGTQTLSLASSTLPAGADFKVHVTAATSETECGTYNNTATLTTRNANDPDPASAKESCAYRVDLSVTKAGSPASQTLGGNITWTIVVTNNGPDTDTGVTVADPMPGGNTFVSATSTQGTCTGGAVLNCNIETMAAGAQVTITLITTPSAAGTQTNTVTVVGSLPETNTGNNTATAAVQVLGFNPPPPVFCVAVSKITPNQLFVGRKTTLTIHLTKHGKAVQGVRVHIKGPKIDLRTKPSDPKGVIKQVVKMKKAGIDTFVPLASKHCNTKRVGVTGVFTPPVTG